MGLGEGGCREHVTAGLYHTRHTLWNFPTIAHFLLRRSRSDAGTAAIGSTKSHMTGRGMQYAAHASHTSHACQAIQVTTAATYMSVATNPL